MRGCAKGRCLWCAGGVASSSPCGPLDSPVGNNNGAFRRVHSSCNTFSGGPQAAHSPNGAQRSRGVASMDLLTYPNSPAALQQAHRRWSFSAHPNNGNGINGSCAPPPPPAQMGSDEFARIVYSQAMNSIHRQQSFALNQLHQVLCRCPLVTVSLCLKLDRLLAAKIYMEVLR